MRGGDTTKINIVGERLLETAVALYRKGGSQAMRRDEIARRLRYSQGTVTNRLGTMPAARSKVIAEGIRTADARVIAWAIVEGHPLVQHMTADAKTAALRKGFVE